MSIVLPRPPSRGYALVLAAFDDLWPDGAIGVDPYPYSIHALSGGASPDDLAASETTGWRYFVPNREHSGYADVHAMPDALRFAGLVMDDRATAMNEAIDISLEASSGGNYEGRVVDVPSVGLSALWLIDGAKSLFLTYVDGGIASAPSVLHADEFADLLRARLVACRAGP